MVEERAIVFACGNEQLPGIVHSPAAPASRGVVILVGGPQYRVGSHRQFVLLARFLAENNFAVFRFDYRGMGDSSGPPISFLECGSDLRAAIDTFIGQVPDIKEVVIWGLCDGATAAAIYAPEDHRVKGLVLLNPWARSERSQAETHLRHYYWKRLTDMSFWVRLAKGQGSLGKSIRSLLADFKKVFVRKPGEPQNVDTSQATDFRQQMLAGLRKFGGDALVVTSELDLTAQEFLDMTARSRAWQALLRSKRFTVRRFAGADHTFSTQVHRQGLECLTEEWLRSW